MKRIILLIVVSLLALVTVANAQTKQHSKSNKQYTTAKKRTDKKSNNKTNTKQNTISLNSVSVNQAYGTSSSRFTIADPTINAFNMRATGNDVKISSSGIVGMPKVTYGLANGKILLRNTTATSSGTVYGSGAVGTGTTLIGIGTSEDAIGVNGKNPYAGPWLWGSRVPIYPVPINTAGKKQLATSNKQ